MAEDLAAFAVDPGGGTPFLLPTRGSGTVKIDTAAGGGTLSVVEILLEPGEGPGLHVHSREHEMWYVLGGTFRFRAGGSTFRQSTGGLAFGPLGQPHTFQNIGDTPGRLLVVSAPSGLEHLFLDYAERASTHHDLDALAAAADAAGVSFVGPPLAVSDPL